MNYVLENKINSSDSPITSIDHFSNSIFEEINHRTRIKDLYLQQLSTGLSGGIGLSGGGCAALSATIMLLGLKFGNKDIEDGKRRNPLKLASPKFMKSTNKLINLFKEKFGSLECRDITNTTFKDIEDFNEYRSQGHCNEINKFLIDFTEKALLN